ncbi:hypothetical protein TNIN_166151 [Trichonephila inaurata madagascariensis]|uniref:Uncharacterized protein n=1 Tax=Trichonephila inaurata madagascariensis TaxID=2747483 RepID=A0A8X6XEA5_9ARAC|nr:hypothetical protein TNIN_166151 [Trichonephila inaurata madagascariensis]
MRRDSSTWINPPTDNSPVLTPSRAALITNSSLESGPTPSFHECTPQRSSNELRNRDVARGPEVPQGPRCGKKTNKFNKIGPLLPPFLLSSGSLLFRS